MLQLQEGLEETIERTDFELVLGLLVTDLQQLQKKNASKNLEFRISAKFDIAATPKFMVQSFAKVLEAINRTSDVLTHRWTDRRYLEKEGGKCSRFTTVCSLPHPP